MTPSTSATARGLRLVEAPREIPRHVRVYRRADGGSTLEWCEDGDCRVDASGLAGCGRLACPSCGQSGTALSAAQPDVVPGRTVSCRRGTTWVPDPGDSAA